MIRATTKGIVDTNVGISFFLPVLIVINKYPAMDVIPTKIKETIIMNKLTSTIF